MWQIKALVPDPDSPYYKYADAIKYEDNVCNWMMGKEHSRPETCIPIPISDLLSSPSSSFQEEKKIVVAVKRKQAGETA